MLLSFCSGSFKNSDKKSSMDGNETFLCDEFEFLTNLKFN